MKSIILLKKSISKHLIILMIGHNLLSCASYQQFKYFTDDFELPSKVYGSDYNQTWKAVIDIMKRFDLSLQNLESGVIKTRWIENTNEINFVDSFKSSETVKAAKFKLLVNVVKGQRYSKEVTRVTIQKRQLVEQDFLQGWKEIPTDGIQEKVLLYRIGRIINIDRKLIKLDEKQKEEDRLLPDNI